MIYVITGPTGSGKTSAANEIATILKCPLINADAFQIYKDMNIGTNKLDNDDPLRQSYRMLDVVTPDKTYSVKEYQSDARKVLDEILKTNENVIIVGGTGLYIKALLYDYEFNEEENSCIDEDLLHLNNHDLHLLLSSIDQEEAKKIHENNRKRVLRAIMLIRNNNETKTGLMSKQNHELIFPESNVSINCLLPEREFLYNDINCRTENMFQNGLVDEVKELLNKYELSITSKQGIGYKEVISFLNNEITFEECIELVKKRTRNYAKRQITFFKHQFSKISFFASKEELIKSIIK